ncbi:MAG: hypothetical protein IPM35_18225 [Myxococcales bacterium]|nr:hypothetical protein [Myxococcales bacterium]
MKRADDKPKRAEARGTLAAPTAPVAPLFVGCDNAIAALGMTWREACAVAKAAGVAPIEIGQRRVYSARQLVEVLERRAAPRVPLAEPSGEALVLARLGRGAS